MENKEQSVEPLITKSMKLQHTKSQQVGLIHVLKYSFEHAESFLNVNNMLICGLGSC